MTRAPRSATRTGALLLLCALAAGCAGHQDKALHAGVGAAAALVVRDITGSCHAGCGAALGIGFAKEAYDATGRGHVDALDAAATAAGCSVSLAF